MCDTTLFLHRPEVYGIDTDEFGVLLIGVAQIIVAKNRSGQSGNVKLLFDRESAGFYEKVSG